MSGSKARRVGDRTFACTHPPALISSDWRGGGGCISCTSRSRCAGGCAARGRRAASMRQMHARCRTGGSGCSRCRGGGSSSSRCSQLRHQLFQLVCRVDAHSAAAAAASCRWPPRCCSAASTHGATLLLSSLPLAVAAPAPVLLPGRDAQPPAKVVEDPTGMHRLVCGARCNSCTRPLAMAASLARCSNAAHMRHRSGRSLQQCRMHGALIATHEPCQRRQQQRRRQQCQQRRRCEAQTAHNKGGGARCAGSTARRWWWWCPLLRLVLHGGRGAAQQWPMGGRRAWSFC